MVATIKQFEEESGGRAEKTVSYNRLNVSDSIDLICRTNDSNLSRAMLPALDNPYSSKNAMKHRMGTKSPIDNDNPLVFHDLYQDMKDGDQVKIEDNLTSKNDESKDYDWESSQK